MINETHDISCAILAGGKAKRLSGENKALIRVGERTNLEKILSFKNRYFKDIFIIANDPVKFEEYGLTIYQDILKGVGPIGGIHSGLVHSESENVFFLPCDMPFLSEEIISEEIKSYFGRECDIIIPRMGEFIEPLHSIFSKRLIPGIEAHIRSTDDYAIRRFFEKSDVYYWDINETAANKKAFFNINTHHDLDEAHRRNGNIY